MRRDAAIQNSHRQGLGFHDIQDLGPEIPRLPNQSRTRFHDQLKMRKLSLEARDGLGGLLQIVILSTHQMPSPQVHGANALEPWTKITGQNRQGLGQGVRPAFAEVMAMQKIRFQTGLLQGRVPALQVLETGSQTRAGSARVVQVGADRRIARVDTQTQVNIRTMAPKGRPVLQKLRDRIKGNMVRHARDLLHLPGGIGRHKNVLRTPKSSSPQSQFVQRGCRCPVHRLSHGFKYRKHRKALEG